MCRLLLLLLLLAACSKPAPHCRHTDLSEKLDFSVAVERFVVDEKGRDTCSVTIDIFRKGSDDSSQSISFSSAWLFDDAFSDCNAVRSYSTGKNKDAEVLNVDYGDIVVADLNFDGLEDLALKTAEWATNGIDYLFLLQEADGTFVKDEFLTATMKHFPSGINPGKRELVATAIAGAVGVSETTFRLSPDGNSWKQVNKEFTPPHSNPAATVYSDLSKNVYFSVNVKRHDDALLDSCSVKVDIFTKDGNLKIQEIRFGSYYLFHKSFTDKIASRSYITGYNVDFKDRDNDWGDLIVADFNFDGREDFAIKGEEGGNGGPLYLFYIQDKSGAFAMDQFLTEKMVFFPKKIDPVKKQLTTLVRANTYEDCERIYQLTGKWEEVSKRYIP